jgi:hypothetical protein
MSSGADRLGDTMPDFLAAQHVQLVPQRGKELLLTAAQGKTETGIRV